MALSSTQKSICNKMLSDYPALVAPVKSAKGSIKAAARDLDASLRSITFSDDNAINNAIDQYSINDCFNDPDCFLLWSGDRGLSLKPDSPSNWLRKRKTLV